MKNILSCTKTTIILLIVTLLLLGFYAYMIFRPVSYGMTYHNKTVYEGVAFEGTLEFHSDGKVLIRNTNFEEAFEAYYYCKNGYAFTLMAQTDEEYEAEVAYIDENFDKAVSTPFYASRINAFRQTAEGLDSDVTTYTCTGAIIFAAVGGVLMIALSTLTAFSVSLSKKAKRAE